MADEQNFQWLVVALEGRITQYERALAQANRTTNRQFGAMERRTRQFETTFAGVGKSFAALFALNGAQRFVDAATRIQNALKVAGLEGEELTRVYDRLFVSAQRNAAPLEALVELYGRASLVQKELGVSTAELLNFTDRIATALRVSGKSAAESSGALLQLSQALGSGIVRAEEFNSILEGALPVAQAAAAGLEEAGGSVAKLRRLVVDGKVSSEAFFRAFEAGASILEDKVGGAELTLSQGFTRLGNVLIDTAGDVDGVLGVSSALVGVMDALGEEIGDLTGFLLDNKAPIGGFLTDLENALNLVNQLAAKAGEDFGRATGLNQIAPFIEDATGLQIAGQRRADRLAAATVGLPEGPARARGELGATRRAEAATTVTPVSLTDFRAPDSSKAREKEIKAIEKQRAAVRDLIGDLEFEKSLIGQTSLEQDISTALRQAGTEATDEQRDAIRTLITEIDAERSAIEANTEAMREFADIAKTALGSFIEDMIEGKSVAESLSGVLGMLGRSFLNKGLDLAFDALIPGFASGTRFAPGGLALVGERGAELINLPRGSRVFSAPETAAMMQPSLPVSFGAARHQLPEDRGGASITIAPRYEIDARGSKMTAAELRALLEANNKHLERQLPTMLARARRDGRM
jgi:tape measure domain-containing protein